MSNNARTRDRLPYNFVDGLKVKGIDINSQAAAAALGFTPSGNISAITIQTAIDELDNVKAVKTDLSASTGSGLIGYETGNVKDVLDTVKPITNYSNLRTYTGNATQIRITDPGIAGFFYKVTPGSAENTGANKLVFDYNASSFNSTTPPFYVRTLGGTLNMDRCESVRHVTTNTPSANDARPVLYLTERSIYTLTAGVGTSFAFGVPSNREGAFDGCKHDLVIYNNSGATITTISFTAGAGGYAAASISSLANGDAVVKRLVYVKAIDLWVDA